ncbi:MAG: HD domain-containing protein [Defluviitaleaceae bacterium]|nr:HD domain-containing protein [Defluviitaleaceae bacterium]
MGDKLLKDSVHGYINIEEPFVKIINTAAFQRLKRIQQTSYRVLYPSASHDRFIHSIGVYHLGTMVFSSVHKNSKITCDHDQEKFSAILKSWRVPFLAACLLHDVGHAPFSHTCEEFYEKNLYAKLKSALGNGKTLRVFEEFFEDYDVGVKAKPHELMSALMIVSCRDELRLTNDIIPTNEALDFIIRAILGCPYAAIKANDDDERQIKNALIQLLNSELIDVDKLDYIVRDSMISGFCNVEMDLPRLLASFVFARRRGDNIILPMYKHSAQSVIENVFTARGNAVRWIMSHNAVVYETALLQTAISKVLSELNINAEDVFCFESLTKVGSVVDTKRGPRTFRYLGDDDIICMLKEHMDAPYNITEIHEYFDRNLRKKAIWKTHSEYIATVGGHDADDFSNKFAPFISSTGVAPYRLECVNKSNFDAYISGCKDTDKVAYKRFFRDIGLDFDGDDAKEVLFIAYSSSQFAKTISRRDVYLLYDGHYESIEKVIGEYNARGNDIDRGFFVYYKQCDKQCDGTCNKHCWDKLKPSKFELEYRNRFKRGHDGGIHRST